MIIEELRRKCTLWSMKHDYSNKRCKSTDLPCILYAPGSTSTQKGQFVPIHGAQVATDRQQETNLHTYLFP